MGDTRLRDKLTATIVDRMGFDVAYDRSCWLRPPAYGLPDAGPVSYNQMPDRMQTELADGKAIRQIMEPSA